MTVQLDQIDNASIRETSAGIEAVRIAHLSAISGSPSGRGQSALTTPGMPRYGDPHPNIPELRVVDVQLLAVDTQQWRATVHYRKPTPEDMAHTAAAGSVIDVQWYSSNVTVDRLYDADGQRLYHWYSGYPTTLLVSGGNVSHTRLGVRQVGIKADRADVQIPSVGVRVVMTETSDVRVRRAFIGSVNNSYWSGDPPRTWLFAGLNGHQERGRWINTYELIYRVDTWDLVSVVEFNGAAPSDGVLGNGIARFRVYKSVNFGQLGFEV